MYNQYPAGIQRGMLTGMDFGAYLGQDQTIGAVSPSQGRIYRNMRSRFAPVRDRIEADQERVRLHGPPEHQRTPLTYGSIGQRLAESPGLRLGTQYNTGNSMSEARRRINEMGSGGGIGGGGVSGGFGGGLSGGLSGDDMYVGNGGAFNRRLVNTPFTQQQQIQPRDVRPVEVMAAYNRLLGGRGSGVAPEGRARLKIVEQLAQMGDADAMAELPQLASRFSEDPSPLNRFGYSDHGAIGRTNEAGKARVQSMAQAGKATAAERRASRKLRSIDRGIARQEMAGNRPSQRLLQARQQMAAMAGDDHPGTSDHQSMTHAMAQAMTITESLQLRNSILGDAEGTVPAHPVATALGLGPESSAADLEAALKARVNDGAPLDAESIGVVSELAKALQSNESLRGMPILLRLVNRDPNQPGSMEEITGASQEGYPLSNQLHDAINLPLKGIDSVFGTNTANINRAAADSQLPGFQRFSDAVDGVADSLIEAHTRGFNQLLGRPQATGGQGGTGVSASRRLVRPTQGGRSGGKSR